MKSIGAVTRRMCVGFALLGIAAMGAGASPVP